MNRFWIIMILTALLLGACTGGVDEDEAEKALKAAFEGESQTANAMFCPENHLDETTQLSEGAVLVEVDCQRQGADEMECETVFDQDGQEREFTIIFRVKDDLLCEPRLK